MLTGLAQILLTRNMVLTFVHLFVLLLVRFLQFSPNQCKKLGEALYRFVLAKIVILLDAICP